MAFLLLSLPSLTSFSRACFFMLSLALLLWLSCSLALALAACARGRNRRHRHHRRLFAGLSLRTAEQTKLQIPLRVLQRVCPLCRRPDRPLTRTLFLFLSLAVAAAVSTAVAAGSVEKIHFKVKIFPKPIFPFAASFSPTLHSHAHTQDTPSLA